QFDEENERRKGDAERAYEQQAREQIDVLEMFESEKEAGKHDRRSDEHLEKGPGPWPIGAHRGKRRSGGRGARDEKTFHFIVRALAPDLGKHSFGRMVLDGLDTGYRADFTDDLMHHSLMSSWGFGCCSGARCSSR